MQREMRRKDRLLGDADTKKILAAAPVGILATVDKESQPYGVPMNFAYENEAIYLHCALEGQKLDNISSNNNVCFTVFDAVELLPAAFATNYQSVIAFGKIFIVDAAEEKRNGLIALIKKYSPDYYEEGLRYIDNAIENTVVLKIEIGQMTGKARM